MHVSRSPDVLDPMNRWGPKIPKKNELSLILTVHRTDFVTRGRSVVGTVSPTAA
jgi:hypothetical protein